MNDKEKAALELVQELLRQARERIPRTFDGPRYLIEQAQEEVDTLLEENAG